MEFISLINAAIIAASIQASLILWHKPEHRGICLYMILIAVAAIFNILENQGLTSNIFKFSPAFQLLFGPALYLACAGLTKKELSKVDILHLIPALISLAFAAYIQVIIVLGTISRIGYSLLTAKKLHQYKQQLDFERSDADEYSFQWMIWTVVITAIFNFVDLIRLNFQPFISTELNQIGQAINNGLWLMVIIFISYRLNQQASSPVVKESGNDVSILKEDAEQFSAIYMALDEQVKTEQLFKIERITLGQLSASTGLQQRDISRAINLHAQKSFNEYINHLRVEYVCQGLQTKTEQSIIDLALEAGFTSKAVFNRSFKQVLGLTPSEYKKQQR